MRKLRMLYTSMVRLLLSDTILIAILIGPLIMGVAFRLGTPLLDTLLIQTLDFTLEPYLKHIDFFLLYMTAMMLGMLLGFFMLEERDEGVIQYYSITPMTGNTYLISRITLPGISVLIYIGIHFLLFTQASYTAIEVLFLSMFLVLQYLLTAMLLLGLAGNKLEGLVVSKMLGLILLPYGIAAFTDGPIRFVFSIFPSFYIGLAHSEQPPLSYTLLVVLGMIVTIGLIVFMKKRFFAKLYHVPISE